MLKEYWFVGDDLVGVSVPVRSPIHFSFNHAFFCHLCGQVWARRMVEGSPFPVRWAAPQMNNECPSCPPTSRKGALKMITYEEATYLDYRTVPTAILAYEFLWLYLAEQAE